MLLNRIMKTEYLAMPDYLINQLGTNEKFTREVNYSHGVHNSNGNFIYYCTMFEGKRYITTQEQKEKAENLYKINVQKEINNIGNKLVFVGMGMDYASRYENDICNHRIRTEIINPEGRNFFIEVGTWGNELTAIDHVIDRDQEINYEKMQKHFYNEIIGKGGFNKIGREDPLMVNYRKYQAQPYHWYKKEYWLSLKIEYTTKNIINLVNNLFGCYFTEIKIECNHLTTNDYTSKSPKPIN